MFWTAVLTVLKVLGVVLLALLALLLLAMFLPLHLSLRYEGDAFTAEGGVWFLRFRLWPRPPKKEKKKTSQKPEPSKEEKAPKAKKKKPKPQITAAFVREMLDSLGWMMRRILAGLHIGEVRLCWPVQGEDAAATAIRYGQVSAAACGIQAALENILRLEYKEFCILPDFDGSLAGEKHFSCKITARLYIIVVIAIYALVSVLPKCMKARLL